ncbi:MAG: glutamine--tRNA ligase/YqeY domain fusion protein, partial [Cyanobacteria bacterium]|nr:glutamine--tRNA ligase/YqeY domain fusion protein [Cyanobacteriota bacterium]
NNLFYASDYFDKLYQFARKLIEEGKAYVCSLSEAEIREYRGSLTQAGKESPFRTRSIAENLDLFTRMYAGEFPDGAHVLRAKIDMANPNMKMRDPLLYRIRKVPHYRAGDKWCIYPLYDFAHCLSDSIEGITHSICTLEFENNRELYDWILDAVGVEKPAPKQHEFARLNLNYTVMSKRKLLQLVESGVVSGWDDPRLHTISGLRRRGYTPESIRNFCKAIGIAKSNSIVDIAQLEHSIRDDLNSKVPRLMCVLRPLKVVITNYPKDKPSEVLDAPLYPHDVPKEGSRPLPFGPELFIEQEDFMETPPKNYYRLSPGGRVRLRHGYIIRCDEVVKDASGQVVELRCSYDPDTQSGAEMAPEKAAEIQKIKGVIHWVSASHAIKAEVRLYDRLFNNEAPDGEPSSINPGSLIVIKDARVEPAVLQMGEELRFQFERQGYFYLDPVDSVAPDRLVFNRVVTLKDSWAKETAGAKSSSSSSSSQPTIAQKKTEDASTTSADVNSAKKTRPPKSKPKAVELTVEQENKKNLFVQTLGLGEEEAQILVEDSALSGFFESCLTHHHHPVLTANWIVNELMAELKDRPLSELSVDAKGFSELIQLMVDETISGKIAKDILALMLSEGGTPQEWVEKKGLQQITDATVLTPIIEKIIQVNPENVARYKEGKASVFGFFVGQVMKATQGKANPKLVNQLLEKHLS